MNFNMSLQIYTCKVKKINFVIRFKHSHVYTLRLRLPNSAHLSSINKTLTSNVSWDNLNKTFGVFTQFGRKTNIHNKSTLDVSFAALYHSASGYRTARFGVIQSQENKENQNLNSKSKKKKKKIKTKQQFFEISKSCICVCVEVNKWNIENIFLK